MFAYKTLKESITLQKMIWNLYSKLIKRIKLTLEKAKQVENIILIKQILQKLCKNNINFKKHPNKYPNEYII